MRILVANRADVVLSGNFHNCRLLDLSRWLALDLPVPGGGAGGVGGHARCRFRGFVRRDAVGCFRLG